MGQQQEIFLGTESPRPPRTSRSKIFNRHRNGKIDWSHWSWNPYTGCLHGCQYCYAVEMAKDLYPERFRPTFRPQQMDAPFNTPMPKTDCITDRLVFTVSMGDLFGQWVDPRIIDKILTRCAETPAWNYLFLTKNPARLPSFDFPPNTWVGATVDVQSRVEPTLRALAQTQATVRFISCEPLLEPVKFATLGPVEWLIIGGQRRTSRVPEFRPPREWVYSLVDEARDSKVPVFFKSNLGLSADEMLMEYPSSGLQIALRLFKGED